MTDANHPLNADAIYAAMAWLRDVAESPEAQAPLRALFNIAEEAAPSAEILSVLKKASGGAHVNLQPRFEVPEDIKEEIYPGELASVEAGIDLARRVLWGPPGFASVMLKDADLNDPMIAALSRYVRDRTN